MQRSIITGTGAYIPAVIKKNEEFGSDGFYDGKHRRIDQPLAVTLEKFKQITGIAERRYAANDMVASDMAAYAAGEAIKDSQTDKETIDQIIVAHNYGDIKANTIQTDSVPSLASRVKNKLAIINPQCVAYDILFGCPGWLQGLIQADLFLRAGAAQKCLVIGTETLSRVTDFSDRDGMIFSDGAGACMVEVNAGADDRGILGTAARSDCMDEAFYIDFGPSYSPDTDSSRHPDTGNSRLRATGSSRATARVSTRPPRSTARRAMASRRATHRPRQQVASTATAAAPPSPEVSSRAWGHGSGGWSSTPSSSRSRP